uniref:Putative ubiA prenyltransferase family n=1 Tax=Helianthus annuus TaxID=4232 RepID=A0A251STW8_HELAN
MKVYGYKHNVYNLFANSLKCLPLLRWKKYPVVVAICSWLFQGVTLPMLFHLHAQTNIHGRPLSLSKHAIFVFGIMGIHSMALLIFKDIPDVEGDKRHGFHSFASKFGQKRVFWICIWLLELIYGVAILIGLSSTHLWIRLAMVTYIYILIIMGIRHNIISY